MSTAVHKGLHGWRAETCVDFQRKTGKWELQLVTMKRSSGMLTTTANVSEVKDGFTSHRVFADYHETILVDSCRVTEKAVRTQHEAALARIDQIVEKAKFHYESKESTDEH